MRSYSQIGQDLHILKNVYPDKRGGFFVEIGGGDGVKFSNTYLMETQYDWKGICIEPNPEYNQQMIASRKCHTSTDCCLDVSGKKVSFTLASYKELSGITDLLNTHKKRATDGSKSVVLTTTTLSNVLDKFKAPSFIDYLSLDTEGSELLILKGVDFDKYTFGYITVEHNHNVSLRNDIRKYLEDRGMVFQRENKYDDDYIHRSLLP